MIIYIILAGYPPFHDSNQTRLFRKIRAGHYKFDSEYWHEVSSEAKVCPLVGHACSDVFDFVHGRSSSATCGADSARITPRDVCSPDCDNHVFLMPLGRLPSGTFPCCACRDSSTFSLDVLRRVSASGYRARHRVAHDAVLPLRYFAIALDASS